ncbi:MAG: hypothetical protein ACREN8_06660 [Candidatus Dormibacteraceae bacterium]
MVRAARIAADAARRAKVRRASAQSIEATQKARHEHRLNLSEYSGSVRHCEAVAYRAWA